MNKFERWILEWLGKLIEIFGILGCIGTILIERLFPFINISKGFGLGQYAALIGFGAIAIVGVYINKFFTETLIPRMEDYMSHIICPHVDSIKNCPLEKN